jgi:DnaK suppressor protein
MSKANVENYRQALEAKQGALAASHRNLDGIAVERVADSMDEVILANERHLALCALTREASMYQQVSAAIERLAAGTFGSCLQCDEPISERRLQALPWAALCLRCQQAADNAQGAQNNGLIWPLSAAA